ncbi:MAG TPA: SiaB family protein kinase [Bacteroidia bacterium]|nr:SiaB family protein kinase [Bacteroidia bacterium]
MSFLDIYDIYDKMERNNILLSFKGEITSELLTSILQIMENKMDNLQEEPKMKKKVYNVLVECLQNLYHHMDEVSEHSDLDKNRSAIFTIGKQGDRYTIVTGNYILNENISGLRSRLDEVNSLNKDQLKEYYKKVLNNGEMSLKGGGGLGMIDIARKTGEKLEYNFLEIDNKVSFFTLNIKVSNQQN